MTTETPDNNELARRLRHVSRLAGVGKVAAGAAHEINQPLNVIRMAAFNIKRSIEKDRFKPESALDKLTRIDEQIERAARLVSGMKSFASSSSHDLATVRPKESVAVVLELMAKAFSAANVALDHDVDEPACECSADLAAMQELVFNLVDNAIEQFLRRANEGRPVAEATISVRERFANNQYELRVSDNGGGMSDDVAEQAFEPFYTHHDDGTHAGLGLTLCREIAQSLRGTLTLNQHADGVEVVVAFPAHPATQC